MAKRNVFLGIFLALAVCLSPPKASAGGLSTAFSEVTLDMETGKVYSTEKVAGLPLVVINTGKEPVDLKIEILLPEISELKKDFEPIPDLGWIRLEKTEFTGIGPNESAAADIVISIPDDERYAGKKYQVFIWSHTVGTKSGVGLKSRLLFSIRGFRRE